MSINYYRLCLTIMSQVNGEPHYKYIINSNKFNEIYPLIQIKFPIHVKIFYLYTHSRFETLHHPYEKSHLSITYSEFTAIDVNYKKTLVELMLKPYSTSCVDYKHLGYNFRSDCIFKCRTKKFTKKLNLWPPYYLSFDSESDLLMANGINMSLDFNADQNCEDVCGTENDCSREYNRLPSKDNSSSIHFSHTLYPILTIKHSPKISVDEFLCFITSIISLWLGFSAIMLSNVFSSVLKKVLLIVNNFNLKTKSINKF
jgi:hypothetical protein